MIRVLFYHELLLLALLKTSGMNIFPLVFAAWMELIDALLFHDFPVMFILLEDWVVHLDFLIYIFGLTFLFFSSFESVREVFS